MTYALRTARLDERPAIARLIELSARGLSRADYTGEQIEAAIAYVYGVDSGLIADGTYFVAEADGALAGCGGWSKRHTLFGGDQYASRDERTLDPARDAAKIRAFFTHPDWARRGIGRAILERCEREARAAGFREVELMSTLPGIRFYENLGYSGSETFAYDARGVTIEFLPMRKRLV